jgi:hypothetical protein
MNPYAFRGWHLPSYPDGANCDRNYHMAAYAGSWHSGYFAPTSVYPFQSENTKQHSNGDWKISPVCTSSGGGGSLSESGSISSSQRGSAVDTGLLKSGYENLIYKSQQNVGGLGGRVDNDTPCTRDDLTGRSCCALSCSCNSHQQRLNVLDNSWRGDMPASLDFNKAGGIPSAYQSLCHRGKSDM